MMRKLLLIFTLFFVLGGVRVSAQTTTCGNVYSVGTQCPSECPPTALTTPDNQQYTCCGVVSSGGICYAPSFSPTPTVITPTCGNVYSVGVSCPSVCPSSLLIDNNGDRYTCCGNVNSQGFCEYKTDFSCGQTMTSGQSFEATCSCSSGLNTFQAGVLCCGWVAYGPSNSSPTCSATYVEPRQYVSCGTEGDESILCPTECPVTSKADATGIYKYCCGDWNGNVCVGSAGQVTPSVPNPADAEFLSQVDPLMRTGKFYQLQTPGDVLNMLVPFLFVFAGMILFVMLLWGGFEMLSSAATPDSKNAGQQRITAAIIGFVLLFVSYWIAQIVQFITGVNILG